jgi:two-component sensor histidine kinase/type II secretory pathway pseudopilin PulG
VAQSSFYQPQLSSRSAVALVTLFLLAIAVLAVLLVWQNYRVAVAGGEQQAQSAAHVVAAHLQWMMEASDQALKRIDATLDGSPIQSNPAIADISQAVGDLPSGFQYSVYDETGELRASSLPNASGINVSDREYFISLRAGAERAISPQLKERLSRHQVFIVARRIERNGSFHGVASIAVPVDRLEEFWSSMSLGRGSSVGAVRTDGWLAARYPSLDKSINLSDTPLFKTFLTQQPHGFYHNALSPADGVARVIGFWKVDGWPLVATAGIDRRETLQVFWSSVRAELLIGIPVVAMLIASAIWIVRLLNGYSARNAALQAALDRNQFLLREVHHRVKNNLQAVSSMLHLQSISAEAIIEMDRRIAAMVAVHEHIYETDSFDRVEVAPYVDRLIRQIAESYPGSVHIETNLAPVAVDRDQALPVGMIVTEVTSNAFKYAFNSRPGGKLSVNLSSSEGLVTLIIRDDGPGLTPDRTRRGMGSRLIAAFAAQLKGHYSVANDQGAVFTMRFPHGSL